MNKEDNEGFKNPNKFGFVLMIILIMMFKCEIIVISLEKIEALHMDIAISILN